MHVHKTNAKRKILPLIRIESRLKRRRREWSVVIGCRLASAGVWEESRWEDPEIIPQRPGGANQMWGIMDMTSSREFSEKV